MKLLHYNIISSKIKFIRENTNIDYPDNQIFWDFYDAIRFKTSSFYTGLFRVTSVIGHLQNATRK